MSSKITIIGAGSVGATIAYKLSYEDIASEIVMIDINKDKAEGEVMDLSSPPELPVNRDRQELSLHRQM